MNYPHGFALSFPYITTREDGTSEFNRALMHTNDSIDKRGIKRIIRKWVKVNLGRTLHTTELLLLMKQIIKHKEPRMYLRASQVQ